MWVGSEIGIHSKRYPARPCASNYDQSCSTSHAARHPQQATLHVTTTSHAARHPRQATLHVAQSTRWPCLDDGKRQGKEDELHEGNHDAVPPTKHARPHGEDGLTAVQGWEQMEGMRVVAPKLGARQAWMMAAEFWLLCQNPWVRSTITDSDH